MLDEELSKAGARRRQECQG